MLNPFIEILSLVIDLLSLGLLVWIILGLLIHFQIVNAYQPLVARVKDALDRLFNPLLQPIRRVMPDLGGLDFSPLILLLGLKFIQSAMYHWLWGL